ncbi:18438_t:CDS:2 [Racocetra fulgida]|uniref:18438_t:CDS:1 n=1 Tax=Racocetra fulgida TaxID=60492 RepID=A0A9N9FTT3_9GLOM|nr:18438_t:CDS:2 [Racocetra fulgida]
MYKYILYKFSDDKKNFVIDKAVETTTLDEDDGTSHKESYEKFYTEITRKNVPYFAVYDFDYEKLGEVLAAASKQVLGTKLGITFQIEGTEINDIEFETVLDKVRRLK